MPVLAVDFTYVAGNGSALENGNHTEVTPGRVVSIGNGSATVTFTVTTFMGTTEPVIVPTGTSWIGQFPPFTQVAFVSSGTYSWEIYA
jgi:hypothetical protein